MNLHEVRVWLDRDIDRDVEEVRVTAGLEPHDPPKTTDGSKDDQLTAYVLVGLGAMIFSIVACWVKLIHVPIIYLMWLRSAIQVIFAVATWAYVRPTWLQADRRVWALLFGRAFCYWGFLMCWWLCLTWLPVGTATAIVYCSPVFAGLVAYPALGERLNLSWFLTTAIDIIGVLCIAQPEFLFGGGSVSDLPIPGLLLALLAALFSGALPALVRTSREIHWIYVEGFTHLMSTLVFCPLWWTVLKYLDDESINNWRLEDFPWLSIVGLSMLGFAALALNTIGFQKGESSKSSLLSYLEIPVAFGIQITVFGDVPTTWSWVGCVLILAASLVTYGKAFLEERRRKGYSPIPDAFPSKKTFSPSPLNLGKASFDAEEPRVF